MVTIPRRAAARAASAPDPAPQRPGSRRRLLLVAIAVVLAATALRFLHVPRLVVDGRVRLLSGDSWYHLRRMAFVADGAGLPDHDRWTHHPKGMVPHWPPLLDTAGGWLARALGGSSADLDRVAIAGIALLGLVTAATFGLAWWMAASRAGPLAGVLAVAVLTLMPAHHNYTRAGKLDHHALEPLAVLLALEALLRACAAGHAVWAWAGLAAVAMVVLVASLPSSSIGLLLLAGAAGLRLLLAGEAPGARRRTGVVLAAAFATAGLLALPLALASPMARAGLVVSFNLSLLQPVLLLACALGLGLAALVPGSRWLAALAGTAAAAVVLLGWPAGRSALLEGGGFVATEGFFGLIDESKGMTQLGWGFALAFLSLPVLLVPVLVWWAAQRRDADGRVLGAVLAVTTVLALVQLRFGVLLAVPLAVVAGMAGSWLITAARASRRPMMAVSGVGAVALVLLWPSVGFVTNPPPAIATRVPVWQALEWLRDHSPSPGDPWQPAVRPGWALLAPWGFGHEVLVVGGRANVASPFIAPGETEGLADTLRFFLATAPNAADDILRAHDARWVLTVPTPPATLATYARALGEDPASVVPAATTAVALQERNGSATADAPAAYDFLRLVFAAEGGEAKLFERVAGARIEGNGATPGSEVLLRVDLDVAGAGWWWFARARADEHGLFTLRVPYSTDGTPPGTVRVLRAAVLADGRARPASIPERAVTGGESVTVESGG